MRLRLLWLRELGFNMIDLLIVVAYFLLVMMAAISGGQKKELTSEEYFLSSRSLRWPSIAFSTIATNV